MEASLDVDNLVLLAESAAKPVAAHDVKRIKHLRKRYRQLVATSDCAEQIAVLQEWAELTAEPKVLRLLASALMRNGDGQAAIRLVRASQSRLRAEELPARRELMATINWQSDHDKAYLQQTARTAALENAAEVQSNPDLLSRLEEMISARIGAAARHIRSEAVLKRTPVAGRSIVYRRTYTKHWFEVSGDVHDRVPALIGDDGTLGVFVKSGLELPVRPELEFILSQHRGRGFRAPYFFGKFTVSGLDVAAWESVDISPNSFWKLTFDDKKRVAEAIAALNVINASGLLPVETRWVDVPAKWFDTRYSGLQAAADTQWKELYDGTVGALKHQHALAADVRVAGQAFLTHNDITTDCSNIHVPPEGDVIIFDWDGSGMSVPGADLGLLCESESCERLISAYVARMGEFGVQLDPGRVRFTADVLRGFRLLQSGWRAMRPDQIRRGLALLKRHTDRYDLQ